jgi:RNA polymerase sigma-70 factor (ECF subfamily)
MVSDGDIRDDLLAAVPNLRAFAISLAGSVDRADDLVQDTLLRALSRLDTFERGTSLQAWLFTILRNSFYSEYRRRKREVEDADGAYSARLMSLPEQEGHLAYTDFLKAFRKLNPDQREALLLVAASGFPYEDAAQIMGVAVGTAKSRVIRARARLAELLFLDEDDALGADRTLKAAMQPSV